MTFDEQLLTNIKAKHSDIRELLTEMSEADRDGEEGVYRFYHGSYKVYRLQSLTTKAVALLKELAPGFELNPMFMEIVNSGTGKKFTYEVNSRWSAETRPIVEAFFHAKHMLELADADSGLEYPPQAILPYGWGTLLHLYQMR